MSLYFLASVPLLRLHSRVVSHLFFSNRSFPRAEIDAVALHQVFSRERANIETNHPLLRAFPFPPSPFDDKYLSADDADPLQSAAKKG